MDMVMDIRQWPKDLIIDSIKLYKSHACLWDVKSKEYRNQTLRDEAYLKIVDFYKKRGFPIANRTFVVKKIGSLRGTFRKEFKKVQKNPKYTPTLWYYDLLMFTRDNDEPCRISNTSSENMDTESLNSSEEEDTDDKPLSISLSKEIQKNDTRTMPKSNPVRKRDYNGEILDISSASMATANTNSQDITEFDAIGINVSKKLARMDPLQVVYAESLINCILRKGMLKQLKEITDFCDSECKFSRT